MAASVLLASLIDRDCYRYGTCGPCNAVLIWENHRKVMEMVAFCNICRNDADTGILITFRGMNQKVKASKNAC